MRPNVAAPEVSIAGCKARGNWFAGSKQGRLDLTMRCDPLTAFAQLRSRLRVRCLVLLLLPLLAACGSNLTNPATRLKVPQARALAAEAVPSFTVQATDTVAFAWCDSAPFNWNSNRWYAVRIKGVLQANAGPLMPDTAPYCYQTPKVYGFAAAGSYDVDLRSINHCGVGDPDPTCAGAVYDKESDPTLVTVVSQAATTGPDCAVPLGADLPSVFVTRWTQSGSQVSLGYQLASKTPILEIQAKVDGATVTTIPAGSGGNLTATGAVWLALPAKGTHKGSVWVRNQAGCTREALAPVDLRVK